MNMASPIVIALFLFILAVTVFGEQDGLNTWKWGEEYRDVESNGFISVGKDFAQCRSAYWQKVVGGDDIRLVGIPFDGSCYPITPANTPNCPVVNKWSNDPCERGYSLMEYKAVRVEITSHLCNPEINKNTCGAIRTYAGHSLGVLLSIVVVILFQTLLRV